MLTESPSLERNGRKWWPTGFLTGIVLLAFALRVFRLDHQSLWIDETISAYLASLAPVEIILNRANSFHPPTYFLVLSGWTRLIGGSEFGLRFLSVCGNLLVVPLIYQLSRRLFSDHWTGYLAALLAAVSPADIVYAQETRVYAILPAAYLLVITCALDSSALRTWRGWLFLALSEVICLYLHLFSAFALLAVNLLLLMTRLWRARRQMWSRWIGSVLLVALLWGPWLVTVWRYGSDIPAKISSRDWRVSGTSISRFYRIVWSFLNTGLVGARELNLMQYVLRALSVLVALATPLALAFDRRRQSLLVILGALLLPLLGAYPVWHTRPLAHPRYLLFLAAPLLILVARITVSFLKRPRIRIIGIALLGSVLFGNLIGLSYVFFDEQYFRFDARSLSLAIAEKAGDDEVVLMPSNDYSLWYYDPAPAEPVNLPGVMGTPGGELAVERVASLLEGRPGAFLVTYPELRTVDPRAQVPFLLENNGRLIDRFVVDRIQVDHYGLGSSFEVPKVTPTQATCAPLTLTGVYTEATAQTAGAVTVALRWQLSVSAEADYKAVTRLWDDSQPIASADVRLLNEEARPTSDWKDGDETVNYYVLPIPLGTPPLTYSLSARVYGGGDLTWQTGELWLPLGSMQLRPAIGQRADPYGSWRNTDWHSPSEPEITDGLLLEGYATRPDTLKPGDTLYVSLRWRASQDRLPHHAPVLTLQHNGQMIADDSGTLFTRYPTERWAAGELLIETRQFSIPATLDSLQLSLVIEDRIISLGDVSVSQHALRWEVPPSARPTCARLADVAHLAAYEWKVAPDQPNTWDLTLYWRALDSVPTDLSYTVFTHLLSSDGELLAQHDGRPASDSRPTTTWVPGEIVVDRHRLQLSQEHEGSATVLVGMYNLMDMGRIPAYDCEEQRLLNDSVHLTVVSIEGKR